jgi:Subtilase family
MRSNNSNNRNRSHAPLALGVLAAAVVLAPVADAAPRLSSAGSLAGKITSTGTPGITGNPGGGKKPGNPGGRNPSGVITTLPGGGVITTFPGVGRNPGGPVITGNPGGGGKPGAGGGGRPWPPRNPPTVITAPNPVTTVTGVTAVTAATTGNAASSPNRGGGGSPPGGAAGGYPGLPLVGETRYVPDEVLVQLAASMPVDAVEALARRMRLTPVESFTSGGVTMSRWKIPDGRRVPDVIRSLQGLVLAVQANFRYELKEQQGAKSAAAPAAPEEKGPHWQYALSKLKLAEAHALAKGDQVLIAVIDSGIDAGHPELEGMVVDSFDALEADEPPHSHGTGIAGAIVAHARLMGVAPQARILAARAFSAKDRAAEATTFSINRSIDWAMSRGARIINMSFTGPRDPAIEQRIVQAARQGIVLVAAAGNDGPNAREAYPAAYSNVIAVTATDADDKLFAKANRGRYVAVAAPGVDVLLPAPGGTYQVATGTSFAAAEVSGIAALMLERKADLGPQGVRKALTASARDLGPRGFDTQFGAGLVDAYQAIRAVEPAIVTTGARPR